MNITPRTHFGIRALIDIAFYEKSGPVQRRHIALRQSIPTDYMDQLLMKLRASGLIHSFRGREGGYHLAKDAREISMLDVMEAVEEESTIGSHLSRVGGEVAFATEYVTDPAITFLETAIKRQFKKYTLAMFLEDAEERMNDAGVDPIEVLNVRPGRELFAVARKAPLQSALNTPSLN